MDDFEISATQLLCKIERNKQWDRMTFTAPISSRTHVCFKLLPSIVSTHIGAEISQPIDFPSGKMSKDQWMPEAESGLILSSRFCSNYKRQVTSYLKFRNLIVIFSKGMKYTLQ